MLYVLSKNTNDFVDVYIKSLEEFNKNGEIIGQIEHNTKQKKNPKCRYRIS